MNLKERFELMASTDRGCGKHINRALLNDLA